MSDIMPFETDIAVAGWLESRAAALATAQEIAAVDSQADLSRAGKAEAEIKKLLKRLKEERLAATRPLDEMKKRLVEKEKELAAPLEAHLDRIHALTTAYATRMEEARQAELRRLAELEAERAEAAVAQEEAQDIFGDVAVSLPPQPLPAAPDRVRASADNRIVERWDFMVLDAFAVPREFCSVDEKKLRAYLHAKKVEGCAIADITIPGVKVFKTMQVQSR